jgi:tRNA1(Val) A37 N6-methylase TrmN6
VFCFPTPQKQRALAAVANAGLYVTRLRDVIPREGLAPLFSLFACRLVAGEMIVDEPLTVRTADGTLSAAMSSVRRGFGF